MYAFLLSGENIDLAKEEVLALSKAKSFYLDERFLVANCKKFDFSKLAFTQKVYNLIDKVNSIQEINKINFQKYYREDFRVRLYKLPNNLDLDLGYDEPYFGSLIWSKLKKPKVDIENAKTKFDFVFTKNNIYICLELREIKRGSIRERDAKFRPGFHPSTMNGLFARALVNLSGIKKNQKLLDPFCGVGAILIEAGLMNCNVIGYDLDNDMVIKCKQNLKFYKIKNFRVDKCDALKIKGVKVDAVVTDPPYGRRSSLHGNDINYLYNESIKKSFNMLKEGGVLVIVMPSNLEVIYKNFKLITQLYHRVHKGLTRKILVLKKLNS